MCIINVSSDTRIVGSMESSNDVIYIYIYIFFYDVFAQIKIPLVLLTIGATGRRKSIHSHVFDR